MTAALVVALVACSRTPAGDSGGPPSTETGDSGDSVVDSDTDTDTDTDTDVVHPDGDHDGYDAAAFGGDDCNDADPTIHPGATENWYDGVDQDCDGADDYDADGDGVDAYGYGGTDCNDNDPTVTGCESPLAYYVAPAAVGEVPEISTNLSGVTWNPSTGSYFSILDSALEVHELDASLVDVRLVDLVNLTYSDLEDLVWLDSSGGDHEYAIVSEYGVVYVGTIPDGATEVDGTAFQSITYSDGPVYANSGGEGIAFDVASQTFWVCDEREPMRIQSFARPPAGSDASYDAGLVVSEPFDADAVLGVFIADISSCIYDPRTGRLLVLSQESERVLDVDPENGDVYGSLELGDLFSKPEGITMNDEGDLLIVGEPNEYGLYVYTEP